MKKTSVLLLLALAMLGMGTASAQFNATNNLFYHTFRTPQSNQLNPAFFPTRNSFYLQLPTVGMQFGSPLAINPLMLCPSRVRGTASNANTSIDMPCGNGELSLYISTLRVCLR